MSKTINWQELLYSCTQACECLWKKHFFTHWFTGICFNRNLQRYLICLLVCVGREQELHNLCFCSALISWMSVLFVLVRVALNVIVRVCISGFYSLRMTCLTQGRHYRDENMLCLLINCRLSSNVFSNPHSFLQIFKKLLPPMPEAPQSEYADLFPSSCPLKLLKRNVTDDTKKISELRSNSIALHVFLFTLIIGLLWQDVCLLESQYVCSLRCPRPLQQRSIEEPFLDVERAARFLIHFHWIFTGTWEGDVAGSLYGF